MARGDKGFDKAKRRAAAASGMDDEAKAALTRKMSGKSPGKLSREEIALARRMDDGEGGEVKPKRRFGK